jgi:outer membrane protein assembly factor BamA
MNQFSLSFPVSFSKSLTDDTRYLSFSPRASFSFLILRNGKLGVVSRHSLYMRFFTDSYYLLGGDELDIDILNLNTLIYGGSSNVTVRGYESGAAGGRHVYYTNNELWFHLFSIEKGLGLVPLMLKNVQGAIFFDYGVGSRDINIFNKKFIAGVGAEIKLYTYWWYRVPVIFSLGVAHGLTESGKLNIYFSMGNSF